MNSKDSVNRRDMSWLIAVVLCLTLISYSQAGQNALLLQQSPVDGGAVEPGLGVHQLDAGSAMRLKAVPRPGYQFVTWLGDVDEPTSPVTMAQMDSPKIVIAVFERVQYDQIAAADVLFSRPGGGGGLRFSTPQITNGGGGAGGKRPHKYRMPVIPVEDDGDDGLMGPGDSGDTLQGPGGDVPEPATMLLLTAGGMLLRRRKKLS